MSLASFFYQGDIPESGTLLDMIRETLVACEVQNSIDPDICSPMIDGLTTAWRAAREQELSRGDNETEEAFHEQTFDSAADAERAYAKTHEAAYTSAVRRSYPKYEPGEGIGWWPEGLAPRGGWPVALIKAVAKTIGTLEGDQAVATQRYIEERSENEERIAQ